MESASTASTSGNAKPMTGANGKPLLRSQISDAHPARVLSKDNTLSAKDKNNAGTSTYIKETNTDG